MEVEGRDRDLLDVVSAIGVELGLDLGASVVAVPKVDRAVASSPITSLDDEVQIVDQGLGRANRARGICPDQRRVHAIGMGVGL